MKLLTLFSLLIITACSYAQPVISSFSPVSGPVGTIDTIYGNNFSAVPTNNKIYLGGTKATVLSATPTRLIVVIPAGAVSSTIVLRVSGSTAYALKPFTVTFPGGTSGFSSSSFGTCISYSTSHRPWGIALDDLDGDGKADLLVATNNTTFSNVSVFRDTGTTSPGSPFGAAYPFQELLTVLQKALYIGTADLDGDGKVDLAVTNETDNLISLYRNTTSGPALSFATRYDMGYGPTYGIVIHDFNGDGKPDIATAILGGTSVAVYTNFSVPDSFSFSPGTLYATGSYPAGIAAADIDGDGKKDLVVANTASNTLSVLRNTSSGGSVSFAPKVNFTTAQTPRMVATGDLDGDGKTDVAVTNDNSNGSYSMFRNTSSPGTVSFAARVDSAEYAFTHGIAIGDLNGDGKPEIAIANSNNLTVRLNMSTPGSILMGPKQSYGCGGIDVCIGDLNKDGKPDLITTNLANDQVSWLLNQQCNLPKPVLAISGDTTSFCNGGKVRLSVTPAPNTTYQWKNYSSVIPGTDSSDFYPASSGVYSARVISYGCLDSTATLPVTVHSPPKVKFNVQQDTQCLLRNSFLFTDQSTYYNGAGPNSWKLGNGDSAVGITCIKSYATAGTFQVTHIVADTMGCRDSVTHAVTVLAQTPAGPISGDTSVHLNDTVNYSVVAQSGVTYKWTVNNGTILTGQGTNGIKVKWTGPLPGRVTLTEQNSLSCSDSVTTGISLQNTTGLHGADPMLFSVYPNPVNDQLFLHCEKRDFSVLPFVINDMLGNTVQSGRLENQEQMVSIGGLSPGLYVFTIGGPEETIRLKFVKR